MRSKMEEAKRRGNVLGRGRNLIRRCDMNKRSSYAQRFKTVDERFWEKVDRRGPDECWEWLGARNPSGHGRFAPHHTNVPAHVYAYTSLIGPVPEDHPHLDHRCDNPGCVNPAHLEPATLTGNLYRSGKAPAVRNRAKTHCPQGHPYDEENTCVSGGARHCRTCARDNARRYRSARA